MEVWIRNLEGKRAFIEFHSRAVHLKYNNQNSIVGLSFILCIYT